MNEAVTDCSNWIDGVMDLRPNTVGKRGFANGQDTGVARIVNVAPVMLF
jgi:hypothetical protein